jgi:hypothetical protein
MYDGVVIHERDEADRPIRNRMHVDDVVPSWRSRLTSPTGAPEAAGSGTGDLAETRGPPSFKGRLLHAIRLRGDDDFTRGIHS